MWWEKKRNTEPKMREKVKKIHLARWKDSSIDTPDRRQRREKMRNMKVDLKLFDGGADGGAGSGAVGTTAAGTAGSETGGQNNVGSEAEGGQNAAGIQTTSDTLEQRKAEFEKVIGEYRDLYDERVQSLMKRRIGETKGLQEKLDSYNPLMNLLAEKYGVENADPQKIMDAVNADNSFFEDAALREGLSVEQYKHLKKIEAENKAFREAKKNAERTRQRDQAWARWTREAQDVKNIYPGFDLKTELVNPEFVQLLGSGVGVKAAYQAIHMDEIMAGTISKTAKIAAKRQADAIRAGQARPMENGASGAVGMNAKIDVSKLTDKQIDELAKRARAGEVISF